MRETLIQNAIETCDREKLALYATCPQGLRGFRKSAWPILFLAPFKQAKYPIPPATKPNEIETIILSDSYSCKERRTILADVKRTFNGVTSPIKNRQETERKLFSILVTFFHKNSQFSYYQGFHQIVAILLFNLKDPYLVYQCLIDTCINRSFLYEFLTISDMEDTFPLLFHSISSAALYNPALGNYFLNVFHKNNPPLFLFAWFVTLFSYSIQDIQVQSHLFEYLMCQPRGHIIYVSAAVLLLQPPKSIPSRKQLSKNAINSHYAHLFAHYSKPISVSVENLANLAILLHKSDSKSLKSHYFQIDPLVPYSPRNNFLFFLSLLELILCVVFIFTIYGYFDGRLMRDSSIPDPIEGDS